MGLLLRVLAVAVVILFIHTTGKMPAAAHKPTARQLPEGTEVTATGHKIRSLDTFSLLEAVKLPGCLIISTVEPTELPFSAPTLSIEKLDASDADRNNESIRASTITIVIGRKDEIYRVREIATDLASRCNRAVHYYPDGVESLDTLAGILKTK